MTKLILILSLILTVVFEAHSDVYVVIYATHDGQSGHVGLAIDQYEIKIYDCHTCPDKVRYDTIKSGRLIYFDFWPLNKHFEKELVFKDLPSKIYRLPASSAEKDITIHSLWHRGIPNQKGYPCDGILKFNADYTTSNGLITLLDSIQERSPLFNAVQFNCVDFAELGIEFLIGKNINAKEPILFVQASTPNYLFNLLKGISGFEILKDPGTKIQGSFLKEKIMKRNQS